MVHAGSLLQKLMMGTGVQCIGMLAITLPVLLLKSPEARAHRLKEERIGQSALAGYTLP